MKSFKNPWNSLLPMSVLAVSLLAPNAVRAAFLYIDDTTDLKNPNPPETITFNIDDFERGFFINGNLVQQGLGSPASVPIPEANGPIAFSGSWIDLGLSTPAARTIYFIEEGTTDVVSDILTLNVSTDGTFGTISGTFESDITGDLGTLPPGVDPANLVFEVRDGGPADFSQPFLTFLVNSNDIPEPATLLLFGTGLAGLAVRARRRRTA